MASFKVGDRVKFLNQEGAGVVKRIISSILVSVEIEDGFEIPTMVKELVLNESDDKAGRMFVTSNQNGIKQENRQEVYEQDEYDRISPLENNWASNKIEEGVYFCYVPHDQKWLVTGQMDLYLINNTPYDLLFSLFLLNETGGFEGTDYGSLEVKSKILLSTIDREDIEKWTKGAIQILFHSDNSNKVLQPLSVDLRIRGSRFFKEDNYVNTNLLREKSLFVTLCKLSEQRTFLETTNIVSDKDEQDIRAVVKTAKKNYTNTFLDTHMIDSHTAEIDLHIGELVEDYYLLEPQQMLSIQVEYVRKCINEAIAHNVSKLILIHGVGSGVLKTEIVNELKRYSGVHYFDASMAKYGVGATEVYLGSSAQRNV